MFKSKSLSEIVGFVIGFIITIPVKLFYGIKGMYLGYKEQKAMLAKFQYTEENLVTNFIVCGKVFSVYRNTCMNELGAHGACVIMGILGHGNKISVDDLFLKRFTPSLQEFVLRHEAGHILNKDYSHHFFKMVSKALKHKLNHEDVSKTESTRIIEMELDADKVAAEIVGAGPALDAMKELYSIAPSEELILRYENLGGDRKNLTNPIKDFIGWTIKSVKVETVSLDELD